MFKRKLIKIGKYYMYWIYSWDLNYILFFCVFLYFLEMNNFYSLFLTVVQGAVDILDLQVRVYVRVYVKV